MPADRPLESHIIPEPPRAASDTPAGSDTPTPGAAATAEWPVIPGYAVTGLIAKGGMGAVYAARDLTLNREVAVKTVLPHLASDGRYAAQFDREVRLMARLSHPGVPPVHALGALPDGRPFLAMKLIRGRTLADELTATDRVTNRPRLLGVFEQICQAVGYAHARGLIHRDLKPSNVMVGEFGEVQVMDWGLAKEARGAEVGVRNEDGNPPSIPHSEETVAGRAKGTPGFMAPEQARGEWEAVDARADVFALGGILCVLLTGKPAFAKEGFFALMRQAGNADLGECFARLDACGADAELVALCKRCLSAAPADRPADGRAVAEAVAAYRAGVDERARRAEADRAAAQAEAREQRKRRRVQLALGCVVALLVAVLAGAWWWQDKQERDQEAERIRVSTERRVEEARLKGDADKERELKGEEARQGVYAGLTAATSFREQYRFAEAEEALARALDFGRRAAPNRISEVEQAQRDLAFVVELDGIRLRKWNWVVSLGGVGRFNTEIAPPEYSRAFRARGFDFTTSDAGDIARRLSGSAVKADLIAALDDWAVYESDPVLRQRLLAVTRTAAPGAWTDRLRDPAVWLDADALKALAGDARAASASSPALSMLARLMHRRGLSAARFLAGARVLRPSDFELAIAHGLDLYDSKNGLQIAPFESARALRPDVASVWYSLGYAYSERGDLDESITAFNKAIALSPFDGMGYNGLGLVQFRKRRMDEAIASFRKSTEISPTYAPGYDNLGSALAATGDWAGAIAAHKAALRIAPGHARSYSNLGFALARSGDLRAALEVCEESVRLAPHDPELWQNVGRARASMRRFGQAAEAFLKAIELNPSDPRAYSDLGVALGDQRKWEEAIKALVAALRCDPASAHIHNNLGFALEGANRPDVAVAVYKAAVALAPRDPVAYTNIAAVHFRQQRYHDAVLFARAAIEADPKFLRAQGVLGLALQSTGDISGARAALTEAAKIDPRYNALLAKLPPLPQAPAPREVKP